MDAPLVVDPTTMEEERLETSKIPRPGVTPRFMNFTLPLLCDYCKKGELPFPTCEHHVREDEILNSARLFSDPCHPRPLPGSQLRKVAGNEGGKKVDAVSVPSCYFLVHRGTRHTRAKLSLLAYGFYDAVGTNVILGDRFSWSRKIRFPIFVYLRRLRFIKIRWQESPGIVFINVNKMWCKRLKEI